MAAVNTSCINGDLRLAEGTVESEGRVEVCYDNQWGTVCNIGWDNTDATVVCRQMGFISSGRFICILALIFQHVCATLSQDKCQYSISFLNRYMYAESDDIMTGKTIVVKMIPTY